MELWVVYTWSGYVDCIFRTADEAVNYILSMGYVHDFGSNYVDPGDDSYSVYYVCEPLASFVDGEVKYV